MPYKAVDGVVDALSAFLCRIPQETAAELIPHGISALAKVFPTLTRSPAVEQNLQRDAVPADLSELRQRAFSALRDLLFRIGERFALVISIDDLQRPLSGSATCKWKPWPTTWAPDYTREQAVKPRLPRNWNVPATAIADGVRHIMSPHWIDISEGRFADWRPPAFLWANHNQNTFFSIVVSMP